MLDPNSKPFHLPKMQKPPCHLMIQTYKFHYTPCPPLHYFSSLPILNPLLPPPTFIITPPSPLLVKATFPYLGHSGYGTGVFVGNKPPGFKPPRAFKVPMLPMCCPKPGGSSNTYEAALVQSSVVEGKSRVRITTRPNKRGLSKWRPKPVGNGNDGGTEVAKSSSTYYDFSEVEEKTTLMIKNIPNKFSKEMLLQYLDKHCCEENEKLKKQQESESDHPSPPDSEYDFVYVPMDFSSGCNLGYAFVNFTTSAGAVRFYQSYHNLKWGLISSSLSRCGKVCEIKHARIQGLEALVEHFAKSHFGCHRDDYMPTMFYPPRNGDHQGSECSIIVGRGNNVVSL